MFVPSSVIFITLFFCHLSLSLACLNRTLVLSKAYQVMREEIKKKIRFSLHGQCEWLGEIKVQQVLPNKFAQAIGPYIFLEHILSFKQSSRDSDKRFAGKHSHPLRGIATLTYI